ncbi:MAG: ubiquinol-cytochrome C chaperone [Rubritepida sp.]|nr:ubiquinol-cytochrome C chaperone [Rubritepida sp.]MCU0943825.1 ubiquinol-cytochrome C chaperone [Rubritepida sp.]
MPLFRLLRRRPYERAGFGLYAAAVEAARAPRLYAELGAPDTTAGRFELICLHVALVIRRLRALAEPRADALSQAMFDAMFSDMDVTLREMGVGDLSVGKKVKNLWEGFHGRAEAYGAALDAGDMAGLAEALARNVWAAEPPPEGAPAALAAHAAGLAAGLDARSFETLEAGRPFAP